MTQETIELIESAFDAVFNNRADLKSSEEFNELCEQANKIAQQTTDAVDVLDKKRDEIKQNLQRLGDSEADPKLKRAVIALWRHSLAELDTACKVLGRE